MPKPRSTPVAILSDLLEPFDAASVAALGSALSFIADTADQLGEPDVLSLQRIHTTAEALQQFGKVLAKYRIPN